MTTWKDPYSSWDPNGPIEEIPTSEWRSPESSWDAASEYKVPTHPVGRLRYYYKWPGHGKRLWKRLRYFPTRRTVLKFRGEYNPKTLRREKTIVDKRPIWWMLGFIALMLVPFVLPDGNQRVLLSAAAVFSIYAAINLCWMLVIGTAGIYSLATYAIVGAGAYGSAYLSIHFGLPIPLMLLAGGLIGLVFGILIAIPAIRLEGFYYALLTLGIVELCRVYIIQSKAFGSEIGGLYGAASYIPESWDEFDQLRLGYYAAATVLVAALILFRFINGKRLGRVLRMAPEKREAFAEATGVNYRFARIQVFLISSIALGVIGAFYATHFRGASPNLFGFDTVAMGLAMLVIGGLGRAEGAVLGTLIVVFIDRVLIDLGPLRVVLIGVLMLFVVLFLRGGVFGIKTQFRAWRDKKKSEHRSARAEKGGEMLPEEATEIQDKDQLAFRRYDKNQRDFLKTLVTDEVIEEFKKKPLGQHSEALERLLTYFRRQPMVDKYAIQCVEPFKAYQIVALSGLPGVAPRLVEDEVYTSREDAYVGVFTRRVQDLLES
ncbi:MAG: branched-chain amino acid ABC transporter permease [Pseudomonadota bacterium]|nr:branched-chain amino acid ABC transporter permease [Pseudomonadota bacterium]